MGQWVSSGSHHYCSIQAAAMAGANEAVCTEVRGSISVASTEGTA